MLAAGVEVAAPKHNTISRQVEQLLADSSGAFLLRFYLQYVVNKACTQTYLTTRQARLTTLDSRHVEETWKTVSFLHC